MCYKGLSKSLILAETTCEQIQLKKSCWKHKMQNVTPFLLIFNKLHTFEALVWPEQQIFNSKTVCIIETKVRTREY